MAGASRGGRADPVAEIRADIDAAALKPVYLLFGQEPFLQRQSYDRLFAASVSGGPRGFNEQVFQGENASGDAIASAAAHLPMMAPRRTVVVRSVNKLKKDEADRLAQYCASPSPTTVLLLLGEDDARKAVDGRSKLAKAIKKHGRWCEFRKRYGRALREWIDEDAQSLGKRLEHGCAHYMETLVGNDLAQIHNGLRHAALFVGDNPQIRLSDLEEVISGRRQEALWDMLDQLGERRRDAMMRNLQLLWRQGEPAFPVLALARRRVRQLLDAERGRSKGMSNKDALLTAGVPPNMAWKFEKQLGRYRPVELQRGLSRLLEAESDLKGGLRIDGRWALERALLDVVGLPKPRRR